MTYLDLLRSAEYKLDKGHITLRRYEEMIEPLKQEIQPERKLDSVWTIEDAHAVIHDMSTEESKITKCKDCRFWENTLSDESEHFCAIIDGYRNSDFYCADAERRNNDL